MINELHKVRVNLLLFYMLGSCAKRYRRATGTKKTLVPKRQRYWRSTEEQQKWTARRGSKKEQLCWKVCSRKIFHVVTLKLTLTNSRWLMAPLRQAALFNFQGSSEKFERFRVFRLFPKCSNPKIWTLTLFEALTSHSRFESVRAGRPSERWSSDGLNEFATKKFQKFATELVKFALKLEATHLKN